MKKLFIVVLYKINVEDSPTIKSFINCKLFSNENNSFVIWDNSPSPRIEKNLKYVETLPSTRYISHTENTSLAKVYNTVVAENTSADYIAIFDQDTEIKDFDYEKKLDLAIEHNPNIYLFMPIIRSLNGQIYSPGKNILPAKNRKIKSISYGINRCKNLVGISSGLVISANYLRNVYKFNEKLKLYGVDTDFFYHYAKNNRYLYLLELDIAHDLSFENTGISKEENWRRFLERNYAYLDIYTNSFEKLFVHIWMIYYKILKKCNLLRYK